MTKIKQYQVLWSNTSKKDLKNIHNFIKKKSPQGAKNVVLDIRQAIKTIIFPKQTEIEIYYPNAEESSLETTRFYIK